MKIKLVAIILTVAMFVGCGSTATSTASSPAPASPSTPSSTAPAPAETTPATKEKVELKIMSSIQTEAEAPLEQAMADAFMKANPNIKITFIPQKVVDLQTKIMALNISNELPDAFYMPAGFMSKARSLDITIDAREYMSAEFNGAAQSHRPNEVGGLDEYGQGTGGGNHFCGADIFMIDKRSAKANCYRASFSILFT